MKILTFDVETTGLPDGRPTTKQTYRWPFIVQFSWMVYDASKNKVINVEDHIVKLPKDCEGKQTVLCCIDADRSDEILFGESLTRSTCVCDAWKMKERKCGTRSINSTLFSTPQISKVSLFLSSEVQKFR